MKANLERGNTTEDIMLKDSGYLAVVKQKTNPKYLCFL